MPGAEASSRLGKRLGIGSKYSRSEVLRLRELFDKYDKDKNGRVTVSELMAANAPELTAFRTLDINRDGFLTFNEYLKRLFPLANDREFKIMLRWGARLPPPAEPEEWFEPTPAQLQEIRMLFLMMDHNRNGVIEIQELVVMAKQHGYEDSDVEELLKRADRDLNGTISFGEFVQLMRTSYI